ncbi:MAG TPA: hypothetical protein VGS19_29590 [Streptosporangiaceae bacterium]|nr:hypothetical protein [Streptosporangiaceae bacterium]
MTESEKIDHYAIIGSGHSRENPAGIVRRRYTPAGRVDEALQRDLSWQTSSAITQWEYGNYPYELAKLSAEEAGSLVERFREKWALEG